MRMLTAASRSWRQCWPTLGLSLSGSIVAMAQYSYAACDDQVESQVGQDDQYNNLPEEDEPTSCQICKINRQGPCRPMWRKFERCMKDNMPRDDSEDTTDADTHSNSSTGDHHDHDDDDNTELSQDNPNDTNTSESENSVGTQCDKYMMPWVECIQKYPGIYTLLANKVYQEEFLDQYELELKKVHKIKPLLWKGMDVDWSDLWAYAKANNMTLDDFGATPIDWKHLLSGRYGRRDLDDYVRDRDVRCKERVLFLGDTMKEEPIYDQDTFQGDPPVVEVRVRVPMVDPDGRPIDVCYVRDQTGRVLGFDQFNSQKDEGVQDHYLRFHVQPGKTCCVKFYKVYKGTDNDDDIRFHVSKAKFLVEAAFEADLDSDK